MIRCSLCNAVSFVGSYLHSCAPPIIHGNLTCDTIFIQHNGLIKIGSGLTPPGHSVSLQPQHSYCSTGAQAQRFPNLLAWNPKDKSLGPTPVKISVLACLFSLVHVFFLSFWHFLDIMIIIMTLCMHFLFLFWETFYLFGKQCSSLAW